MLGCLLLPFKLVFVVLKLAVFLGLLVLGLVLFPLLLLVGLGLLFKTMVC